MRDAQRAALTELGANITLSGACRWRAWQVLKAAADSIEPAKPSPDKADRVYSQR